MPVFEMYRRVEPQSVIQACSVDVSGKPTKPMRAQAGRHQVHVRRISQNQMLRHRISSGGSDPALAGGVVLTTITDVVGYMAFLGLGATFLL